MKKINKTQNKAQNVEKNVENALVGAAFGIAAGIALAPELGKKFYNEVKKKSAEFQTHVDVEIKKYKVAGQEAKKAWKSSKK